MTTSKGIEFCKVVVCGFLSNHDCIWFVSLETVFCLFELYSRSLLHSLDIVSMMNQAQSQS